MKPNSSNPERLCVCYIRVSTIGQAMEGIGLPAQRARLAAWAQLNNYRIAAVHADEGISGKESRNRPGVLAAVDDACRRGCPLVVIALSRLARSVRDAMTISERLERAGADLVSVNEHLDTTSASGRLVFRLLALLAQFERELIAERTSAAMSHLRTCGRRISGKLPFGFALGLDGRSLIGVPDEQRTVALMAEMRADASSFPAIARELERRGIRTKGGRQRWNVRVVRRILLRADVVEQAATA